MNIQGIVPAISAPIQTPAPRVSNTSSTGTNGTDSSNSSSTGSASSLQNTFMDLLVTELQNQDPTAPVDPTEMVTQMVSLNSLDQLISINSTLENMSGTGPTTGSPSADAAASPTAQMATASGNTAAASARSPAALTGLSPLAAAAPNGGSGELMNLYGGVSAPASNSTSRTQGAH